jgi:hypothetical protein
VSERSLANKAGYFEWIDARLKATKYSKLISYCQNMPGLNVTELLRYTALLDTTAKRKSVNEICCKKEAIVKEYISNADQFTKFDGPIYTQILELIDYIETRSPEIWSENSGENAGMKSFSSKKPSFDSIHVFRRNPQLPQMYVGVLFPILSAFKEVIRESNDSRSVRWKLDFNQVLELFDLVGFEMLTYVEERLVNEKGVCIGPDAFSKVPHTGWTFVIS